MCLAADNGSCVVLYGLSSTTLYLWLWLAKLSQSPAFGMLGKNPSAESMPNGSKSVFKLHGTMR